jgi:hypothetical protein
MAQLAHQGGGVVSAGSGWRREGERGCMACGLARPAGFSTSWAEGHWVGENERKINFLNLIFVSRFRK